MSDRTLWWLYIQYTGGGGQGGRPLPPPAPSPPPSRPLVSLLHSGAACALHAQNFPFSHSLPFCLPSPSSHPLFSLLPPPLLLLPPSLLPPPSPSSPPSRPSFPPSLLPCPPPHTGLYLGHKFWRKMEKQSYFDMHDTFDNTVKMVWSFTSR